MRVSSKLTFSSETKDLIHDGIATFFQAFPFFRIELDETKDLIHEGIATFLCLQ